MIRTWLEIIIEPDHLENLLSLVDMNK